MKWLDVIFVVGVLILVVGGLHCLCGADPTITNIDCSPNLNDSSSIILSNNSSVLNVNGSSHIIQPKKSDVMYSSLPRISMYAKPSCGCRYSYAYWYKKSFVNYCPYCKKYNCLLKNPKRTYEHEYTCVRCNADFCAVCGKEKMRYSRVYLQRW